MMRGKHLQTTILVLSILSLVNAFMIPVAIAYAPAAPPFGPKWRNSDIGDLRIYIYPNASDYTAPLRRAVDLWNSMRVVRFTYIYSADQARITVLTQYIGPCGLATVQSVTSDGYIVGATIMINPGCSYDFDWLVAAFAHELGHAIGLGHSRDAVSIMGVAWDRYRIPAPLYDDIIAVWMLYGRGNLSQPSFIGGRGQYAAYNGGPAELGRYPCMLNIAQAGINSYVFYGYSVNFLPYYAYMIIGYVNPHIVYRGAIGILASTDITDITRRPVLLEFSGSGNNYYIALSYTSSSNALGITSMRSYSSDTFSDAGFFIQLILYWDRNYNTRAMVIVYRGTDIEAYLSIDSAPALYYNLFSSSTTYYAGFAVWTDSSTNPAPRYNFGPIWLMTSP